MRFVPLKGIRPLSRSRHFHTFEVAGAAVKAKQSATGQTPDPAIGRLGDLEDSRLIAGLGPVDFE